MEKQEDKKSHLERQTDDRNVDQFRLEVTLEGVLIQNQLEANLIPIDS